MSFAKLKQSSAANFEKLNQELSKLNSGGGFQEDTRYWQPTVDSAGNGYAVIRFLPGQEADPFPFVRLWHHGFKGPTGQWYIENCLSTLKKDDPVMEYNNILWNSTDNDKSPEREQARAQKRKLSYISNIYVVDDPAKPENNGKVFLFKYGKKIYDKLNELMNPQFEDEKPADPFNFWDKDSVVFKLKIRKVEGYRNYDKSEFVGAGPLSDDEEEMEKVYESVHSLAEIVDEKNFKSYDELKKKLDKVLGLATTSLAPTNTKKEEVREELKEEDTPPLKADPEPSIKSSSFADDDDDDDFFARIMDED